MIFKRKQKDGMDGRNENEIYRAAAEFSPNFEYWLGEKKEVVFVSPSCERVTGYSQEEFIDNPGLFEEVVHPDDHQAYAEHLNEYSGAGHEEMVFRVITKDGSIKWISHRCSPVFVDGKFAGRRGSNCDITESYGMNEQFGKEKKMECLGIFAGGVAHDFNNVLASVGTFIHLLQDEVKDADNDAKEYVDHIALACRLGKNMASNLLAFGQKQISNRRPVKLNAILGGMENIIRTLMPAEVEFSVSLDPDEVSVLADPNQIEQICINLSVNARDAMLDGGSLDITTSLQTVDSDNEVALGVVKPGTYMTLAVSDTGSGFDVDDLLHIFNPFYSTKASKKGTGLGLAIVRNIVEGHGAFLGLETGVGEGAIFTIYFPVVS